MIYTAALSEWVERLCNFTTGCRESLGVSLNPSFARFYLSKGDKMELLFPDVSG